MELRSLIRPAAQLLAAASRRPAFLSLCSARGHKTTARTKRALKIAPHPSFLPDRSAAFPAADSIIYNPPEAEASPYHTPFIFLPPEDPRRQAILEARRDSSSSSDAQQPATSTSSADADLPPAMRYHRREPRYHLKEEDVAEMRRLRLADPVQWSVGHLAQKFDCSPIFVRMVAPAPPGHIEWLEGKLERKMARWGPKKRQAREDRKRRAEMMYRGEL
ncbi:mitochondrial ribosomal protein [Hirsutella rhossiliensis]|uniref:Mitochondrial ribosomal protein n=1 Tax=Hirsutella rhossiliensis TaxID=111463 RepID=A0A9P8MMV7_9HYPO|nr:mitochondrial ribosomal protein [Hirsutella rhossiliensis]KAH0958060.1 mitochondrial ribosomal protein [Hirsutella rhossiliensis]